MNECVKLSFPGTIVEGDTFTVPVIDDIMLSINSDCSDPFAWDTKGTDYSSKISTVIDNVNTFSPTDKNKLLLVLQQFRDLFSKSGIAGMDGCDESKIDVPPYDGSTDSLWSKIKSKYNVNTLRKLKIVTYGTVYIHETPKECQQVFNSAVLRGGQEKKTVSYKMLIKLRGTDARIQQDVRNAVLFQSFIEDVVSNIESKNLTTIAIVCRAGHHRSVACAEMLKNLYMSVSTEHLTIDH